MLLVDYTLFQHKFWGGLWKIARVKDVGNARDGFSDLLYLVSEDRVSAASSKADQQNERSYLIPVLQTRVQ